MQLHSKRPEDEKQQAALDAQLPNYVASISYLSRFIEMRAGMGDMTTREVMDEIEKNVCILMRQGYDGPH